MCSFLEKNLISEEWKVSDIFSKLRYVMWMSANNTSIWWGKNQYVLVVDLQHQLISRWEKGSIQFVKWLVMAEVLTKGFDFTLMSIVGCKQ